MANGAVARPINWHDSLPFLRMLHHMRSALNLTRLLLAFWATATCYLVGRALDSAWSPVAGVLGTPTADVARGEVGRYSELRYADFLMWKAEQVALEARIAQSDAGAPAREGPFSALVEYEARCAAAGVRALLTGHWGYGGGALASEPSLLGSIASAARGGVWLVRERPWFAVIYGIAHLLILGIFGTAICRHAAIQSARGVSLEFWEALNYAWARRRTVALLSLGPAALLTLLAALLALAWWLLAMFCGIPVVGFIGYVLMGLLFVPALLAGALMTLLLLAGTLAMPLARAAMAAKGGDAMDAGQSGTSYVIGRPWRFASYVLLLGAYAALAFTAVRLVLLLLLKLTHSATAAGFSGFGRWSNELPPPRGALGALWNMPAWSDLALLPGGALPVWGTFGDGPLTAGESVAQWLIQLWVFALVGLLLAYGLSLFYTGATQIYFLLRRDVDGDDYDDVYFVEEEDPFGFEPAGPETPGKPVVVSREPPAGGGVPLPVIK